MSDFHPIRRLATGGMAEVFLAMQLGIEGFEKLVVLKQILPHLRQDEEFVQMFLEEARLAATLHHPNIVATLDVHRDEKSFFIALEYISGEDLRYILGKLALRKEKVPIPIACRILADVASALDYAHNLTDATGRPRGIVHRDVGPSNIIVDYQGITRLVDFGIAKADAGSVYTKPGVVKGKFGYMAPEHVQHRPLDLRADVFSLGVVMHEVLTGRRLFKEPTLAAIVQALVSQQASPPSEFNTEVPREIDRVVLAALEKDRDARTQSAREVVKQLESCMHIHGGASHSDVAAWMQASFADRRGSRQSVEREVVLEGRRLQERPTPKGGTPLALSTSVSGASTVLSGASTVPNAALSLSNTPSSGPVTGPLPPATRSDPFLGSVQTGSQLSMGQISYSQAGASAKSRTILIAALIVLVLLLVGSVAYLLGRDKGLGRPSQVAEGSGSSAKPVLVRPKTVATKTATLIVHVFPAGATVEIGGKRFDDVGPTGTMVPIPGSSLVDVVIKKVGFVGSHQRIRLPVNATEHLHVNLKPQPASTAVASLGNIPIAKNASSEVPIAPAKVKKVKWRPRRSGRRSKKIAKGKLLVAYAPVSAILSVDGRPVDGRSPVEISGISTGRHHLSLAAPGYKALTRAVTLAKGKPLRINFALARLGPAMGSFDLTSTPSGAWVSVDGRRRGKTPLRNLRLIADSSHKIEVSRAGYQSWISRFSLTEGKNPPLVATLKPVLAAVATPKLPRVVAAPSPAPTPSPAPAPQRVSALLVPMSMKGDAKRGKGLFTKRCGLCHGKTAPRLATKSRTRKQWSRYFAYGRHRVRAPLGKVMSRSELAAVKAFLMSRGADVASANAAGVR